MRPKYTEKHVESRKIREQYSKEPFAPEEPFPTFLVWARDDWQTDWLTGWLADQLTEWLNDWLADWMADLTDWSADWSVSWLTDWLHIIRLPRTSHVAGFPNWTAGS